MLFKYRKELPTIKLLTEKQVFKSPSFCRQFGAFLRHNDKLMKTCKISETMISESREQCQKNSGTAICILLALSIA